MKARSSIGFWMATRLITLVWFLQSNLTNLLSHLCCCFLMAMEMETTLFYEPQWVGKLILWDCSTDSGFTYKLESKQRILHHSHNLLFNMYLISIPRSPENTKHHKIWTQFKSLPDWSFRTSCSNSNKWWSQTCGAIIRIASARRKRYSSFLPLGPTELQIW